MRTRSPRIVRSPPSSRATVTVRSPVKRASPRMKSRPGAANIFSCAPTMAPTMPSLWARSLPRSTRAPCVPTTPKASSVRASLRRRAEFTSDFVGMHATLMHVPPTNWRSTMATFQPAFARSIARDFPALPPPTTSRSTVSISFVDMVLLVLVR